jgi:hypothetical protein
MSHPCGFGPIRLTDKKRDDRQRRVRARGLQKNCGRIFGNRNGNPHRRAPDRCHAAGVAAGPPHFAGLFAGTEIARRPLPRQRQRRARRLGLRRFDQASHAEVILR